MSYELGLGPVIIIKLSAPALPLSQLLGPEQRTTCSTLQHVCATYSVLMKRFIVIL